MISFDTASEAKEFVREIVDVPVVEQQEQIKDGLHFHAFTRELGEGKFANVYDVNYRRHDAQPLIHTYDQLTSVYDYALSHDNSVTTGGGFFYLTDQASGSPRQQSLNLAFSGGLLRSLPVVDRETVLARQSVLSVEQVLALGELSINGKQLDWSGSLADHSTELKVFGNGNTVITHESSDQTSSIRVLDESSRYTPAIEGDTVDVGFNMRSDGVFMKTESSALGGLDIFSSDVVVRCPEKYLSDEMEMVVHTIGSLMLDGSLQGALSVGPALDTLDFDSHPINKDASLGSKPPFVERAMARAVLYETDENVVHIRLYDGRPGSEEFVGVTPSEAVQAIKAEGDVVWGCFLDPGQTAKLHVRRGDEIESYGNRHYLKWPEKPGDKYIWVPKIGRPVSSLIAV